MQKMNRKQYEAAMTVLVTALENRRVEVSAAIAAYEICPNIELGDIINQMHDAVSAAEQMIKDLEHAWDTRNFTAADWTMRELITSNID